MQLNRKKHQGSGPLSISELQVAMDTGLVCSRCERKRLVAECANTLASAHEPYSLAGTSIFKTLDFSNTTLPELPRLTAYAYPAGLCGLHRIARGELEPISVGLKRGP